MREEGSSFAVIFIFAFFFLTGDTGRTGSVGKEHRPTKQNASFI